MNHGGCIIQEPPSRYLLPEQERLGSEQLVGAEMPEPVPGIHLRRLLASDDGAEEEAAKLRSALQTWGFFLKQEYSNVIEGKPWQLEGYGNDPVKTQDQILDWADRLHLTVEPEDERNIARWPRDPESFSKYDVVINCKRKDTSVTQTGWIWMDVAKTTNFSYSIDSKSSKNLSSVLDG